MGSHKSIVSLRFPPRLLCSRAAPVIALGLLVACQVAPAPSLPAAVARTSTPPAAAAVAPTAPLPTALPTVTPLPRPTATPLPAVTLREVWGADTFEAVWAIAAADLDGDGVQEVLAGSHNRVVVAWDLAGQVRWKFASKGPVYSVAAGDIDGDRLPEVIAGDDANVVYCLNRQGSLRWQRELSGRVAQLALLRSGGNACALVAVTWDGAAHGLDAAGKPVWQTKLPGMPLGLVVADLDGDGLQEALIGTRTGHLVALTQKGSVLWDRELGAAVYAVRTGFVGPEQRLAAGLVSGRFILMDVGGRELWAGKAAAGAPILQPASEKSERSMLMLGTGEPDSRGYGLDQNGQVAWHARLAGGVWDIATGDVDGDGRDDWLVATEGGTVAVLSADGQVRGGWSSPSRVAGLLVRDLDADGKAEVFVREGRFVHLLRFQPGGSGNVAAPPQPATLFRWDSAPPSPPEGTIALAAVGDIMLARTVGEFADRYGPNYPFEPTAGLLRAADVTIGNLECALSLRGEVADKFYVFRGDPQMADGLKWAGFDLVGLANNHVLDYGTDAMADTLSELSARGILAVGGGGNSDAAYRAQFLTVKGLRLAFLAFAGYSPEGFFARPDRPGVARLDVEAMTAAIKRARLEADLVIVQMHAGIEYSPDYSGDQQLAAHRAVDAGATLVIGHHPHVLQGTEVYKGAFIAYSLGNFVFDIDSGDVEAIREGAVLWVWLSRDGVKRAELWPTFSIHDAQPRLLVGGEGGTPQVRELYVAK